MTSPLSSKIGCIQFGQAAGPHLAATIRTQLNNCSDLPNNISSSAQFINLLAGVSWLIL